MQPVGMPLLLMLVGGGLWAGSWLFAPATGSIASRISVLNGSHLDIEVPLEESRIEIRFNLLNTGAAPVAKPCIQRSCNCIQTSMDPEVLAPGGSADVILKVVLARMERNAGDGTILLRWPDDSTTKLSFGLSRKRSKALSIRPVSVTLRSMERRSHPMLTFVADYSPEPAPAPAQFRIETGNDRSVDLEDVRQLGMHALTGSILLDSSLMKVGALSFHGLGLPEARIVVR